MADVTPRGEYQLWDGINWYSLVGPQGPEGPPGPVGPEGPPGDGAKYLLQIGNRLTDNQASSGKTEGTTKGFGPSNSVISIVDDGLGFGDKAIRVKGMATNPGIHVHANADKEGTSETRFTTFGERSFTVHCQVRAWTDDDPEQNTMLTELPLQTVIFMWGDSGPMIDSIYGETQIIPLDGQWHQHQDAFVTVPGAKFFSVRIIAPGTSGPIAIAQYDLKDFGVWDGAGGEWAMPGTPIVNQGVSVDRPHGTDLRMRIWDRYQWDQALYDSGTRIVTSLLANGWTSPSGLALRRFGQVATLSGQLRGSSATSEVIMTLPSGFRPGGDVRFLAPDFANEPPHTLKMGFDGVLKQITTIGDYSDMYIGLVWGCTGPKVPPTLPGTDFGTALVV